MCKNFKNKVEKQGNKKTLWVKIITLGLETVRNESSWLNF